MEQNRKTDLAFKLLDNIQGLIKFADSKINVLLVVSGVTTTFVLTNFQTLVTIGVLSKIVLVLFFLFFLCFIVSSLFTISARRDSQTGMSAPKTIYFEHIANRVEARDFIDEYKKISEDEFLTDVLYQVYETSKIACKKFYYYKISKYFIQVQVILFLIIIGFKIFA